MDKKLLVGAAVGSGIVALAAERGGADFLLAINAGRMRNMGAPSVAGMLPIKDARELTESFAVNEVLSQTQIPVFLGVDCWGSTADPKEIAMRVQDMGFAGAVNFPTSIHYPTSFQHILARADRGVAREVEILAHVQALGLTSLFYCASRAQARLACEAKLDMILLNFGWNTGGAFGHRQRQSLEEAATIAREFGRFVKRLHPSVKFLLEGGPVVTAEDLGRVLQVAPLDGYVGGSTIERLPLEASIAEQIASYKFALQHNQARDEQAEELVTWGKEFGFVGTATAQLSYLSKLRTLGEAQMPVLLTRPIGADVMPTLNALNSKTGEGEIQSVDPAGQDKFGAAGRRIFGSTQGETRRIGALGDEGVTLLVIYTPERLSPRSQLRLARAIKEGSYTLPGTRQRRTVMPRLVFVLTQTSSEELPVSLIDELAMVLCDWHITMPTISQRAKDIPALLQTLIEQAGIALDNAPRISDAAMQILVTYDWPGNEDELRTLSAHITLGKTSDIVGAEQIEGLLRQIKQGLEAGYLEERSQKAKLVEALWKNGFHRSKTAKALGISRKTLYNKIQKYGLSA